MGSINKQISRYETTAVYTHPDAVVDIILVHGLNGDPQKTWTAKNGVFWPSDLLPASLRDARANVLVYGYNADVYSKKHGSNPSDNFIYMHAQTLVTSLTHYRKDEMTSHNPIIWVCHSLGGILVKRALLYSNDLRSSQHEDYRSIYVSTYGIIFLGTPHTGSGIATWGTVLQAMSDAVVPRSFFQTESVLLKTLKRDNETLQNINSHFLDIYQRFKILMAHENHKTDLKSTRMLVVDANSASPQLPGVTYYAIEATHSGMCKFESKNAPGYRTVATAIREWVGDAPDVVTTRWRVENDEKLARAQHEIEERMKPWIQSQRLTQSSQAHSPSQQINETTFSPQEHSKVLQQPSKTMLPPPPETPRQENNDEELFPTQPSASEQDSARDLLFVRPAAFRPNTYFKGREKELRLLHTMLQDCRKRTTPGTTSVLIQSMPGGGKSHLARQYIFQHRRDYPGGIFWVRAKSIQELDDGYYDLAKAAGLSHITNTEKEPYALVKAVQGWLSSIKDWLLVLDGIHFDIDGLFNYIPFSKHGSIIYTSTEKTPGEGYLFDNPQLLALEPLTKREAQEMLFEQMGKKQPYTQDDLQRAEELVDLMDRLPLMIHVAALQMNATREPLAKYLRAFKSRPRVGGLPAYLTVREQLEHRGAAAALNLISILAFFGSQIPVEMIALGAKALDRSTPVKSTAPGTRKRTLNNTFKTLIAFALIERNESTNAPSSSGQTAPSVEQDSLDIIRVRNVVQAFFVDLIDEEKQIHIWLERAVCVFCGAFDASVDRVEREPQAGIPGDYRRFLSHGQRLLAHVARFEKRENEIACCRGELESRLDTIQGKIDLLAKRVSEARSRGEGGVIISVFERTSSISEDEATDTTPSTSSAVYDYDGDDATTTVGSPIINICPDFNPYHWHVHYTSGESAGCDTSTDMDPRALPVAIDVFQSMSMPDDDEVTRTVFGPNHRTVKKHAERRYHDHAGAWRASPQIISDPRVTISRETARGLIAPISPDIADHDIAHVTGADCQSEAELSLNSIQKGTPQPETGLASFFTSNTLPSRPRLVAGRPSYADARAEEVKWHEGEPITPTFSYPPPTSQDATAAIMRIKGSGAPVSLGGLTPVRVSSPLADMSHSVETLSAHDVNSVVGPEASTSSPRSPPSRPPSGSLPRSSKSSPSPSQQMGPFLPPPIPIEVNTTSSLRPVSSSTSYNNNLTTTAGHRLSTYSIGEENELARSLPTVSPLQNHSNLPYPVTPHTVQIQPASFNIVSDHGGGPPAPWVASLTTAPPIHPSGYSSQPMSRNASRQSAASRSLSISPSPSFISLSQGTHPYSHTDSPMLSISSPGSSPESQMMLRPRSRRPSLVETEPSPRIGEMGAGLGLGLDGADPVVTSYQLYNENQRRESRRESRRHSHAHVVNSNANASINMPWDQLPENTVAVAISPDSSPPPGTVLVPVSGSGFRARWRSIRSRSWSRRRQAPYGRSVSGPPRLAGLDDVDDDDGELSPMMLAGGENMIQTGSDGGIGAGRRRGSWSKNRTGRLESRSPLRLGSTSTSTSPVPMVAPQPGIGSGQSSFVRGNSPSAGAVGLGIQSQDRRRSGS
ncbi:hypothetical protein F5Y16DRAFT_377576 [Xylariaceae sp. FL0255]|nr:hypothetical protein F5Y16DRAFT_377576 [Xylariaceae sp. FL0255]